MKKKYKYNIKKSFLRLLPFGLLMAIACHKDSTPQPTQDPNPTPVETYDIVLPWSWDDMLGIAPPKDTIKFYANHPSVSSVSIHLMREGQFFNQTFHPTSFHKARDTLQSRIDINPEKVKGSGVVMVGSDGAHVPPDTNNVHCHGMWLDDSIWFTEHGWAIERLRKAR